jgi:hypothetical protein
MISTFKIKTTKGVHVQPYYEILLKKGKFINELPPSVRNDNAKLKTDYKNLNLNI